MVDRFYRRQVISSTWARDSHDLFDFEVCDDGNDSFGMRQSHLWVPLFKWMSKSLRKHHLKDKVLGLYNR